MTSLLMDVLAAGVGVGRVVVVLAMTVVVHLLLAARFTAAAFVSSQALNWCMLHVES